MDHIKLHTSAPDDNGVVSLRFEFLTWPRVVPGVIPEDAVKERYEVELPQKMRIYAASAFFGLDRGDRGEYALEVGSIGGPHLWGSSLHKEETKTYQAWTPPSYVAMNGVVADRLQIWTTARTTGPNDELRPGEPWSSRPHFGLMMWAVVPKNAPQPPSEPPSKPPPPEKNPKDYIPWEMREEWARRVELAYTTWRGARDLEALLAAPYLLKGGHSELVPLTTNELKEIIIKMVSVDLQGQNLAWRIRTVKHREIPGRCQVRKVRAHEMVASLSEQTEIYSQIAAMIPDRPDCDSIKCKIEKMNER